MVLVDSSIWIDYFKGVGSSLPLDALIETNDLCVNDLILAELLPSIKIRKENRLMRLLESVERMPMDIDWPQIVSFQIHNLKNGINDVGIPDLMIAQNAIQHDLWLFAKDKHFRLMKHHVKLKLFEP
ncbi:MAG: PIN domain-containing protein [Rectinemataceae bacterium]